MTERPRILALFGSAVLFGQERGNIEALSALMEEGCDVLCLVRDESWSIHITPALDARGLVWQKVPYVEHRLPGRLLWVLLRNPIAFLLANWRFLWVVRQYRPTHIHAFNQLYVLNFLLGLMFSRVPMVYRAGDQPIVHNWIWRSVWHFVVRRTSRFVAISEFISSELTKNGVDSDRITVIYNYPPMRPQVEITKHDFEFNSAAFNIAYVGQLSEHKGVKHLIEAVRQLAAIYPNVQLRIAGRISDWEGDDWARALRDTAMRDPLVRRHVTFLGFVENIPALLRACDLLVAPTLTKEPLGNVVMEAKHAERAAVVYPRGGLPEMVQQGIDGIVCHDASVPALVEALKIYLENPELIATHGKAARASMERLGISEFGRRWLEVYTAPFPHCILNAPAAINEPC